MADNDLIRRGDALDVFTDWSLGPEEAIAKLRALTAVDVAQVRAEALHEAAAKAEDHLTDWSNDLEATRNDLIDAQTTGVWCGRKVRDKAWLVSEARRFNERAEAVAESALHTRDAILALKGGDA